MHALPGSTTVTLVVTSLRYKAFFFTFISIPNYQYIHIQYFNKVFAAYTQNTVTVHMMLVFQKWRSTKNSPALPGGGKQEVATLSHMQRTNQVSSVIESTPDRDN